MPKTPLELAKEALDKVIAQKKLNEDLVKNLGPAIIDTLKPVLEEIAGNSKLSKEELLKAIEGIKINIPKIDVPKAEIDVRVPDIKVPEPKVTVNIPDFPEIKIPEIKIPAIKIPKIEIPEIKIPKISIPDIVMPDEMNIKGWIGIMGYDRGLLTNPLPVQLRDSKGNPVSLDINQYVSSGGGRQIARIGGIDSSAWGNLINPDGRLKTEAVGSSGLTDAELRAAHLDVLQMSGAEDSVVVNNTVDVRQLSGSSWSVSVNDAFRTTVASALINADDRLRVSLETGGSGLTDTELRAASVDVQQASGAIWSVSVNDAFRTTVASALINADDRLRVSLETGGSGLTDAELRATAVPVTQVSGASWSVEAAVTFDQAQDEGEADGRTLRVVHAGDVAVSTNALATSPDVVALQIIDDWDESDRAKVNPIVGQAGVAANQGETDVRTIRVIHAGDAALSTNAIATSPDVVSLAILDDWDESDRAKVNPIVGVAGVAADQGEVDTRTIRVVHAGNAGASVSATQVGTWTVALSGALTSAVAVGPVVADSPDDGNAPVQIGGVARTANPSAVAANDVVKATFDDLGRQLIRNVQIRDLIQTARASVTNVTETTLLAGSASTFHDLIYVLASNNSTGATAIDIRSGTANGVVLTIDLAANGVAGVSLPVPIPQDVAANAWTFQQQGDVSTTTVTVSALFSKEI